MEPGQIAHQVLWHKGHQVIMGRPINQLHAVRPPILMCDVICCSLLCPGNCKCIKGRLKGHCGTISQQRNIKQLQAAESAIMNEWIITMDVMPMLCHSTRLMWITRNDYDHWHGLTWTDMHMFLHVITSQNNHHLHRLYNMYWISLSMTEGVVGYKT